MTGDDFGKVKVFRFPSLKKGYGHTTTCKVAYNTGIILQGAVSAIQRPFRPCNQRPLYRRSYAVCGHCLSNRVFKYRSVISIGGADTAIFQWQFLENGSTTSQPSQIDSHDEEVVLSLDTMSSLKLIPHAYRATLTTPMSLKLTATLNAKLRCRTTEMKPRPKSLHPLLPSSQQLEQQQAPQVNHRQRLSQWLPLHQMPQNSALRLQIPAWSLSLFMDIEATTVEIMFSTCHLVQLCTMLLPSASSTT